MWLAKELLHGRTTEKPVDKNASGPHSTGQPVARLAQGIGPDAWHLAPQCLSGTGAQFPEKRMRHAVTSVVCAALASLVTKQPLHAQPASTAEVIPVVSVANATAVSTQKFGGIVGIRELRGGRVLVNDGGSRQLRLFDSTLVFGMIVLDSASEGPNMYGRGRAPIIPYLGDSTLFPDNAAFAMLVIDEKGQVIRSMALPTQSDLGRIRQGAGLDQRGRLVYLGDSPVFRAKIQGESDTKSDSFPLLRADFDLRRTDTIAQVLRPMRVTKAMSPDGGARLGMWMVDPLRALDDWTILSDGTVALVRGHDYHVDWIRDDDARSSSGKLPFDWKQLSDTDKQRVLDSIRVVISDAMNDGSIANRVEMLEVMRMPGVRAALPAATPRPATGRASTAFPGFNMMPDDPDMIRKVHDYYPPVRSGAALADVDGNLWILPTTSKQSQQGELVYDVINSRGVLFRRVRVPLGRLIVGFGKDGVVYMSSGSIGNGFVLERSHVPTLAQVASPPAPHNRSTP